MAEGFEFDAQECRLSCMLHTLHFGALEIGGNLIYTFSEDKVKFLYSYSRASAALSVTRRMIHIKTQLQLLLIGVSMTVQSDRMRMRTKSTHPMHLWMFYLRLKRQVAASKMGFKY